MIYLKTCAVLSLKNDITIFCKHGVLKPEVEITFDSMQLAIGFQSLVTFLKSENSMKTYYTYIFFICYFSSNWRSQPEMNQILERIKPVNSNAIPSV